MEINSNPTEEKFSVCWANHNLSVSAVLQNFYDDETYADCSLAADGAEIVAHKIVLSACSPYLNSILRRHREKHPIIVLRDVNKEDLYSIVEYMYKGQVEVLQHRLQSFLQLAQSLEVLGLFPLKEDEEIVNRPKKRTRGDSNSESPKKNIIKLKANEIIQEVEYLSECSDQEDLKENDDCSLFFVECAQNSNDQDQENKDEEKMFISGSEQTFLVSPDNIEDSKIGLKGKKARKMKKDFIFSPQLARGRTSDSYEICCDNCHGTFRTKTSYHTHLRYDCNQLHPCLACDRIFKNKRHLLDHVRDDCGRLHVCPSCHRTFKQKVNLTTHQKHYCKPKSATMEQVAII